MLWYNHVLSNLQRENYTHARITERQPGPHIRFPENWVDVRGNLPIFLPLVSYFWEYWKWQTFRRNYRQQWSGKINPANVRTNLCWLLSQRLEFIFVFIHKSLFFLWMVIIFTNFSFIIFCYACSSRNDSLKLFELFKWSIFIIHISLAFSSVVFFAIQLNARVILHIILSLSEQQGGVISNLIKFFNSHPT